MNIGVILAAGSGKRFKSLVHKQYLKINGKEMVFYPIDQMRKSNHIEEIILVVDEEEFNSDYIANKYGVTVILGGATRNQSIQKAIDYISLKYGLENKVIFHDSVRPFVQANLFDLYIEMLDEYDCIATSHAITDSLSFVDGRFADRSQYTLIQAPEAVRLEKLANLFDPFSSITSIIGQVGNRLKSVFYSLETYNMKITFPEDLFLAEQFMRINYSHLDHIPQRVSPGQIGKVLLLGASGGIGGVIKKYLDDNNIEYRDPDHIQLNLKNVTVNSIEEHLGNFKPDIIINAAATYFSDEIPLLDSFDDIFSVNVRANIALIEYAKTLAKRVNIVFLSSSSSTMGRKNLTNYSAAKAALNSIVESQAPVLKERDIYLNAIVPEKVNTPLIQKLHKTNIDTRELLEPEDVLNAILYYSVSDDFGKLVHIRKGL